MRQPIGAHRAKPFEGHVSRRGGESKVADVLLRAALALIVGDQFFFDLVGRSSSVVSAESVAQGLSAFARL